MSSNKKQAYSSGEIVKPPRKRRRKTAQPFGEILRDFLERTGLNNDLEEVAAKFARSTIEDLWASFKPLGPGEEPSFSPPPPKRPLDPVDEDDPYAVLGVTASIPQEVLNAVYRTWAKTGHPDVGGDEEAFKRINIAYDKIKKARGI